MSLTKSDIIDIRRNASHGWTAEELAKDYGMSAESIRKIISNKTYQNVPHDKVMTQFPNYAVTADGRVYSFTKKDYLVPDMVGGREQVRLSRTVNGYGDREYIRMDVSDLVEQYFG